MLAMAGTAGREGDYMGTPCPFCKIFCKLKTDLKKSLFQNTEEFFK